MFLYFFLIYVAFVDILGATYFYDINFPLTQYLTSLGLKSTAWYNLFWFLGSILFVLYYVYNVLKINRNRVVIVILSALFFTVMVSQFIIYPDNFFKTHHSLSQLSGAFTLLIASSVYLIELISSNSISNAFKTFSFYALSAVLIWWIVITPILFFDAYNTEADWDFVNLKRRIILFANIFMYTCFIVGLIVSKPQLKDE